MVLEREPATEIEYRLKDAQHEPHIFDSYSLRTTSCNVVFGIFAGYALFQAIVIITLTLAVVSFDT